MPFDDHKEGGGDGRHDGLPLVIQEMERAAEAVMHKYNKCPECCIVNMSVDLLAKAIWNLSGENKLDAALRIATLVTQVADRYNDIRGFMEDRDKQRPN